MSPSLKTIIAVALLAPFVGAILAPLTYRRFGRKGGFWIPFLSAVVSFGALATLAKLSVQRALPLQFFFPWVDSLKLGLYFSFDGFGGLFSLLVSFMGLLILWYARSYMEHEEGVGRFFGFLLFFLGSMLGVCLAEHLMTMFFFWELTSISSFFLIGFWHHKEESRAGALKALVITSGGGLAMLAGLALLGGKTGLWTWTQLYAVGPALQNQPWMAWAFVLILLGAFTKSAQFPYHIWLPDAMQAPTPVSAFLHSATMVKAGIILVFRLYPIFSSHYLWVPLLTGFGMTTVVVGAVLALKHRDLKAILAYSTISQLGLFMVMQGYASFDQILRVGLIFHIFVHAFYKGALFMLAGIIDHGTGTRDIGKLGRLRKYMPKTAVLMVLAAGSLAGLPPFLGFISKEGALEASLHAAQAYPGLGWILPAALTFSAALTVAVAGKLTLGVFFAPAEDETYLKEHHPHEASFSFLLPPALLASAGLLFGLFPSLLESVLFPLGNVGLLEAEAVHFKLWHGLNPALGLSALAVLAGATIYVYRKPIQRVHEKLKLTWNLNTVHDRKWEWTLAIAKWTTNIIQNGSLTMYVGTALGFLGVLLAVSLAEIPWSTFPSLSMSSFGPETLVALGLCFGTLMVVLLKDRVARIFALGAVGLLMCLYFIVRGAPDLALTGFLVEVVMFIVILLIYKQMEVEPHHPPLASSKFLKIFIASLAGGALGLVSFVVLSFPLAPSIAEYFKVSSSPLAGGLNVVNVVVVDFRGFDTFGEIAVVCLAGLGVFALRRVWVSREEHPPQPKRLSMRELVPSEILKVVSGITFPLAIAFSIYMTVRGHNAPGGGFIGGLITAGAFVLEMMAEGRDRFLKTFPIQGRKLFVGGLSLAFATAVAPLFLGYPLLTSYVFESIHFSTASIFDLGVYFVVVGVTLEIIELIEEGERRLVS